jgi:hypothetical protein
LNDGASAAKLRFNEFYQLEFQCIYSKTSKADYLAAVLEPLKRATQIALNKPEDDVDISEAQAPWYSEKTLDINVKMRKPSEKSGVDYYWKEVASISKRTDYGPDHSVLEIAFGLDRLVELSRV